MPDLWAWAAGRLPAPTLWALLGVLGTLAAATLAGAVLAGRGRAPADLLPRLRSWWVMALLLAAALLAGRMAAVVLFGAVSYLALKEYLTLAPSRRADRRLLLLVYLAVPLQYALVARAWYGMFVLLVPVYLFLALPALMALAGETRGFLRAAGTLHWGAMISVFALSHAAFLLVLPESAGLADTARSAAGGSGLLLTLLILTGLNDVAQYVSGRLFGRVRVAPRVSPNKTVAGLLGGLAATAAGAALLAPLLTPFPAGPAALLGLLIGGAGFLGDLSVSAIKRDAGVKDTGTLLPGHGGMLDRVDSLVFTAPLFLHAARYLYF